ncbi:PspA/IM30 family protein [Paenibacillus wenxiniae]|uniref:PspA/IM30 family protein n=1 Tax=Paenibacillus wenxiniae TaxID=1636843 RepID=A0ABW4RMC9_9BACL
MNMFKRIRDITVATLNEKLEQSQDPVKLIDQFLLDTRHEIAEAEQLHHNISQHTRQLQHHVEKASAMREKREEQAMLALKAEEEELARMALQEKVMYEEKETQYNELLDKNREALNEIEYQLNTLKSEYQIVYSKREYYHARMETLRLQQQMNRRFGNGMNNMPSFNRLEDRISDWELEAKAMRDIRQGEDTYTTGSDPAKTIALDAELERLRRKLDQQRREG